MTRDPADSQTYTDLPQPDPNADSIALRRFINEPPQPVTVADPIDSGHALAHQVLRLLADHRELVKTVALTKYTSGAYSVSFETYSTAAAPVGAPPDGAAS